MADGWVGAIKLPSGRSLYIEPKVPANLYRMLAYALELHELENLNDEVLVEKGQVLPEIIAAIFVKRAEEVLSQGLYKTYRAFQGNLNVVRGKILVERQVRRWQPYLIECEYEDLTSNCLENRALLYSAHVLRNLVTKPELGRELGELVAAMESQEVELVRVDADELARLPITRLNEYYSRLLEICRFVVENAWVERFSGEGEIPVFGFLVDASKIFEEFLTKLVVDSFPEYDIEGQDRVHNLLHIPDTVPGIVLMQHQLTEVVLKPDIILRSRGRNVLVVDAKYKPKISNNDIFQAISYSLALGTPTVLVMPEDHGEMMGVYQVVGQDNRVFVMTINVGGPGELFEERVREELLSKVTLIIGSS